MDCKPQAADQARFAGSAGERRFHFSVQTSARLRGIRSTSLAISTYWHSASASASVGTTECANTATASAVPISCPVREIELIAAPDIRVPHRKRVPNDRTPACLDARLELKPGKGCSLLEELLCPELL